MRRLIVFLFVLLSAARVGAQPVFDAVSSSGAHSTTSLTFEHVVGVGGTDRYIGCGVSVQNPSRTVISATFNGVPMTRLAFVTNIVDPNTQSRAEFWYLVAPDAVPGSVVFNWNALAAAAVACLSFTGVDQINPHGTPATASGTSATSSVVVSSATGELVIDVGSIHTGTTGITAGAGQTELVELQSAEGIGNTTIGMSSEAGAASTTMTWDVDNATSKVWTAIGVALKPTAVTPPSGNQITVCAVGCAFTNAQLQAALDSATCGDEVLLEAGQTYSRAGGFVMGEKCTTGTWDRITIRTGVSATGSVLSSSLFPAAGVRMPPVTYRAVLAKLIPITNNQAALRTVYPAEVGTSCSGIPCTGDGWTVKWLEFGPKADWLKGRMLTFGTNKATGDSELTDGDEQDTLAEVPDYLTMTQCDMHGDPLAGNHGGLYLSSKNTRVTLNSITDIKSLTETQAITEINGVGPFLIENNLIEATGENIMFGGGDSKLQQSTTITGTPSASSITLTATTELFSGQYISVTSGGVQYSGLICTLTGSTCALSRTMPVTPSAGDVVKWTRMAGGATIRLNMFTKPVEWRSQIIATPTGLSVKCSTTGGTLAAGTYYYRVAARRIMGGDPTVESAAAAEVSGTVTSGTTGSCVPTWVPSAGDTGGTYIFGRSTGAQNMRWSVGAGIGTYTDTGTAGTADTPRSSGDTYVVKNAFELKHLDGGSPAGPNLIEGNVFGPSWCCGQDMIVTFKPWNQSGGDVSSTVRFVTFRKNWIRHGVRGLNISTGNAQAGMPSGNTTDILVEDNLFTDLSTAWGGGNTAIQIAGGNYPNHVGSRGGDRITIKHNTFLLDTSMAGPLWFVMNLSTDEHTDFVFKDNLAPRQGSAAIRAFITDQGQTAGTTSWNAATTGMSVASHNVWPDATSGTYAFSTDSFFPTNATVQSSLVSYAQCYLDIITGCALNGSSAYDSAASDGLDIGANIPAIKELTDVALGAAAEVPTDPIIPTPSPCRTRVRLKGCK